MSVDKDAPWLSAWRDWVELASQGFKSGGGNGFDARAASAGGFADAYQSFARVVQQMMERSGGDEFARRFIESLQAAARYGTAPADNDDFLNVFLRTAPRALLGAIPDAGAGRAWQQGAKTLANWTRELLALPSVGPQREWQEMLKAVQRAVLTETESRAVLDEHYRLANRSALERFAATLGDDSGPPITSLRALYDAWIDEAEAAYAERVMSADFSRDFAAWVNAGSDVRLALRKVGGRMSALFDAPARDEIDALLERQQAMQRELEALRAERDAARTRAEVVPVMAEVKPGVEPTASAQTVVPVIKSAPRAAKTKTASRPRPAKASSEKTPKPTRSNAASIRKPKLARGEFDIGHILDAGK